MEHLTGIEQIRSLLLRQLDTAWRLLEHHLATLTDEECLWRPASRGPHVVREGETWRADWPETEGYEIGPPGIGWLTWHIGFWWSMALDHSFGDRTLRREDVLWPGTADGVRTWLSDLHGEWRKRIEELGEEELVSEERTRWPFSGRPFHQLAGWLNLELMKNASEIGFARFLYAARTGAPPPGPPPRHSSRIGSPPEA